jgi:tetratricopeptide (TPR) repeat protein
VRRAGALAAALALAVLGCGRATPPRPRAADTADTASDALAAFEQQDWERAASLLRQALLREPTSVRLHYALAITASHLGRRDEAIQEFQWILANAPAGSPEARTARDWLTEAGVMPRGSVANAETTDDTVGDGGIRGRVRPPAAEPAISQARLQLFLKGVPGTPTAGRQYVLRTDDDGRFEFKRIPAGTYKLTNRVAGRPAWRMRVELPPGGPIELELSGDNSLDARDDFPGDGR